MTSSPAVTTVVITHNRRCELLRSLAHADDPVVVVDNDSADGTADAVARQFPRVQLIRAGANLGAAGRNLGVEAAATPYVAFADDDSWWAPGATHRAAALLDRFPRLAVLVGKVLVGPESEPDSFNDVLTASPLPRVPAVPGVPVLGFMACAAVVRRQAFLDVGGFDELIHFGGEEAKLAIDLAAAGWLIQYVADIVVHHHPSTRRVPAAVQYRRGVRNALLTRVMRRPWSSVVRYAASEVAARPSGSLGVLQTVPRLRLALRARSCVPPSLEARLRLLEAGTGRGADVPPRRGHRTRGEAPR
ncbi:MAG: glycosyltransferase family 2 protein [Nocardioidaceae bacterium]